MRLKQINSKKVYEQELKAKFFNKMKEDSSKNNKGIDNGRMCGMRVIIWRRIQEVGARQTRMVFLTIRNSKKSWRWKKSNVIVAKSLNTMTRTLASTNNWRRQGCSTIFSCWEYWFRIGHLDRWYKVGWRQNKYLVP